MIKNIKEDNSLKILFFKFEPGCPRTFKDVSLSKYL